MKSCTKLLSASASLFLCGLIFLAGSTNAQIKDYTRWVNPFIGTGGHGHTFPGAVMPFGMVALSPDTRIDNWDGSSGYHYSDDIIYGFSHTHLSGTGIPDGCDILLMPTVGQSQFFAKEGDKSVNGYASKFSHANEKAEPGYYSVMLDDDGILAEMTATERVGFHRYTFPKTDKANLILDLKWRDKLLDSKTFWIDSTKNRIFGWRRSSSWAKNQTLYFVIEFSQPVGVRAFEDDQGKIGSADDLLKRKLGPTEVKRFALGFPDIDGTLLVKVAISYVSIEGARKNLEAEIPGWDFDKVRADAKAAWNKELGKIDVSGGTDDQTTTFYTALYHTMIHPSVYSDVDGKYLGHDGKVHDINRGDAETQRGNERKTSATPRLSGKNSEQYSVFSLWDTFRAAHPLYTIIDEKRTVDFINTFIRIYEQGGRLPVWELWGEETDTMIGYHAMPVIADAMAKGIKGFDYEKAYAAAKHSAELNHFGLAAYKKRGYISSEDENESVSKTLEYAYDDWCIAQMAEILSKRRSPKASAPKATSNVSLPDRVNFTKLLEKASFERRARNFENLFDPSTGFMRPKKNGGFMSPFAPNEVTFNYTEGNAWVYTFFVPHDVSRLMEMMGGRAKFAAKLDELFTTTDKLTGREQPDITGLIGQYAHGNEPSHHIAYLYNYAGQPWKTQQYVGKILHEFYKNDPDGLIGNEDAGQMSAWYILSSGGFYPVAPGSTEYALGTPLFPEMTYRLENGKTFTIRAKNVSANNIYIKEVTLNGRRLQTPAIDHSDITKGGVLEFTMTDKPDETAFSQPAVSKMNVVSVPVPTIDANAKVFIDSVKVGLRSPEKGTKIYYTIDEFPKPWKEGDPLYLSDSTPIIGLDDTRAKEYSKEFSITESSRVKAIAVDAKGNKSKVAEAEFYKRPNDWSVKILSPYNSQYTGGGDDAIIDGLRGNVNFASGEWQGYHGKTFEAVIDLKRETTIREVGGSFLQSAGSWIWMPDRLEFEFSNDGEKWTKLVDFRTGFPQEEMKGTVKEFTRTMKPFPARYVRVRAYNIGKIPAWHAGAGGDPWIFVDEIIIR